jgi:hypothetical protein
VIRIADSMAKSNYGQYLHRIIEQDS